MIPDDLLYTAQHEWIKTQGSDATVGITDHAQNALGDITFVELPALDTALNKGDEALALESCKAAASVYAPASGKITQVNTDLAEDPGLINSDPYGRGWIFQMTICDPQQLGTLLTPQQYADLIGDQN